MGFFPKNAGSRLFNAGFAISDEDSKLIDIAEELERDGEHEVADFGEIGCADVVHLLHSLPRKGNQTELHAIVKTFDVLGISIQSLLEEAQRKEQLTSERLEALDQEMHRLSEELEQRREETNMLNLGLEELNKLQESLQKMAQLEVQDQEGVDSDSYSSRKTSGKNSDETEAAQQSEQAEENADAAIEESESSAESDAEPVALGDAYVGEGEDLIETQKIIDLDRKPKPSSKAKTSMAAKLRAKTTRKRRVKSRKSVEA